MSNQRSTLSCIESRFALIRHESELAIQQVDAVDLRRSIDGDTNSIAIILKQVGGNLTLALHELPVGRRRKAMARPGGRVRGRLPGGPARGTG